MGKRDTIEVVSAIYGVSPSAEAWYEIVSGLFSLYLLRRFLCTCYYPFRASVSTAQLSCGFILALTRKEVQELDSDYQKQSCHDGHIRHVEDTCPKGELIDSYPHIHEIYYTPLTKYSVNKIPYATSGDKTECT